MEVQFKIRVESPQDLLMANGERVVEWGSAPFPRKGESVLFPTQEGATKWSLSDVEYWVLPSGLERVIVHLKGLHADTSERFKLAVALLKEVGFTVTEKNMKETSL